MSYEDLLQALKPIIDDDKVSEELRRKTEAVLSEQPEKDGNRVVEVAARALFDQGRIQEELFRQIDLSIAVGKITNNNAAVMKAIHDRSSGHGGG